MGRKSRAKRARRALHVKVRRLSSKPLPVRYPVRPRPATGTTHAERALATLARATFLSLWSYPNVVRDERRANGSILAKEIVDLLVVFENDILLFSDKDCVFPSSGKLDVDWSRWYRSAIEKSAKQLWGAERHIRANPDRIFLDAKCKVALPVPLPAPSRLRVHRVVVAHGASARCKQELGGSGSLVLRPQIVGDSHRLPRAAGGAPFAIGILHSSKPFVHVLDDTSLDLLLRTLDTAPDFIAYLRKKETFIRNGHLGAAAGEEALLAHYLTTLNDDDEHDFVVSGHAATEGGPFVLSDRLWHEFFDSPERIRKQKADEVSYYWDHVIEQFTKHFMAGTSEYLTGGDSVPHGFEQVLRFFARENRFRRRLLSEAVLEMLRVTAPTQRRIAVVPPSYSGDPFWVLLLFPFPERIRANLSYDVYRERRRTYLSCCLRVVKLLYPDAFDIVGFATESGRREVGSEDAAYLDARSWTAEDQDQARTMQKELSILVKPNILGIRAWEFPPARA